MNREKGMGFCGLACCLCEEKEGCLGCREGTCPEKERCRPYECAQSRALEGCWQCEEFPCQAPVLQSLRTQAFVGYISKFGMEKIMDRLEEGRRHVEKKEKRMESCTTTQACSPAIMMG